MDKTINTPVVTVFMAVFNGEAYIAESIKSILAQSFTDFELLIVNDGSTDRTLGVIEQFNDPRIRVLQNESNKGLAFTRNRGLREARGQYIAILDSDDIALPERLEVQVDFMNAHLKIAICGGQAFLIDTSGRQTGALNVPSGTRNMAQHLVLHNILINSTLMIRTSAMKEVGGYRDLAPAEDYDLSFRISLKHEIANLDRILIAYRVHEHNTSGLQSDKVGLSEKKIIRDIHTSLKISTNDALVILHHDLMRFYLNSRSSVEFCHILELLKKGNMMTKTYPVQLFNQMLFKKWFIILRDKKEKKILSLYFRNDLFQWSFITFKELRKVFKQALFRNLF